MSNLDYENQRKKWARKRRQLHDKKLKQIEDDYQSGRE